MILDNLYGNIYKGEYVIVSEGQDHQWYQISEVVTDSVDQANVVKVTSQGGSLQTYTVSGQTLVTKLKFKDNIGNTGG